MAVWCIPNPDRSLLEVRNLIGISAFGIYLPAYRLSREVIAQATGGGSPSGERTVANYDEDSLTMGVEASLECMDNYVHAWGIPLKGKELRALLFASASSPYREKQVANVVSSVLEVDPSALMTDLGGSLRGGLTAIEVAKQLLRESGPETKALVVAADKRSAEPRSGEEQAFGDGAATLLLGQENVLVNMDAHIAVNSNFTHFWRRENDLSIHSGDTRFVENYGYFPLMTEVIRSLLKETGLKSDNIAKLIVYAPDARLAQQLARRSGFNPETQLADTLYRNVGDTGTPQVFLSLIGALHKAQPGEKLIVVGYGDGAEAILLTVTDNIRRIEACRGIEPYLKRRRPMANYGKYLQFRDVIGESSYDAFSSLPLLWREEKQNLRLYGTKCQSCGIIHFPRRRVCDKCGAKDKMEDFKLSRKGHVYTYTNDHVYLNPDPPETLAAIDLEGGGRFFGQVVDINPQDMRIGLQVELSFRKLHDGQDLPNYFWKAKPAIGGK
jgi:hydroxymethylglutaryl-CoA synthase